MQCQALKILMYTILNNRVFINNNENALNIAKISQILFALERTQDILWRLHLKEHGKIFALVLHECKLFALT